MSACRCRGRSLAKMKDAHPVAVGEVARFMGKRDPWPGYFKIRQTLPKFKG